MKDRPDFMTRRQFFIGLGATAVAAGVALPIGLAEKIEAKEVEFTVTHEYRREDFKEVFLVSPSHDAACRELERLQQAEGREYARIMGWSV